jgi:CRISPR-associated protein Cas6
MVYIELSYPVIGVALPDDHGGAMFRAISRLIPEAHGADWLTIDSMAGLMQRDGLFDIEPHAQLRMRMPQSRVPLMLKLLGRPLDVGSFKVELGAPRIFLLQPSVCLYARCVTIANRFDPGAFLDAVAFRLDSMGIGGEPELGGRRAFRIGRRMMVGFGLTLHDLDEDGSIALQEQGMGNYRHYGCGFFANLKYSEIKCRPDVTI